MDKEINILLNCSQTKNNVDGPCEAQNLYRGGLFSNSLKFAYVIKSSRDKLGLTTNIFILSSKYGVLACDSVITTYDKYLNKQSAEEREKWRSLVLNQFKNLHIDITKPTIFLLGPVYRKLIEPYFPNKLIIIDHIRKIWPHNPGSGRQCKWLTFYTHLINNGLKSFDSLPIDFNEYAETTDSMNNKIKISSYVKCELF